MYVFVVFQHQHIHLKALVLRDIWAIVIKVWLLWLVSRFVTDTVFLIDYA